MGNSRHSINPWGQVIFLGALALAAYAASAAAGGSQFADFDLRLAVTLAAAFFATRLLTIRLPQGDEVYVTLVVGLTGIAVGTAPVVISALLAAGLVESIARFTRTEVHMTVLRVLDLARSAAILAIMTAWHPVLVSVATGPTDVGIVAMLAVGALYSGLDILTVAIQQRIAGGQSILQGIASLQRPLVTMYLVHLAMAAVVVRLYAPAGTWVFPIALLLTLILQNSFNLYLRIRRGYAETIGALAHAAELDRPHDSGHARRVADLAVAVGKRIGLASRDLERIGYAALLHDIGRMGDVGDDSSPIHAKRGAEIVASVPFLADVAPLLGYYEDVYADGVPAPAAIVRICSHYDRLRMTGGARQALDTLAAEAGETHGRVLSALEEVVHGGRRGIGIAR